MMTNEKIRASESIFHERLVMGCSVTYFGGQFTQIPEPQVNCPLRRLAVFAAAPLLATIMTPVLTPVDSLTSAVQAAIDPIAAAIHALIDPVTSAVQPVLDTVTTVERAVPASLRFIGNSSTTECHQECAYQHCFSDIHFQSPLRVHSICIVVSDTTRRHPPG
jgi:hypothetical protein